MMSEPPAEHEPNDAPLTRPDHHGVVDQLIVDGDTKKRRRKKLLRLALVLVLLVALLIALTPTLLSTGAGTRLLIGFVNNKLPGEVAVDDLQLSWLGGQRAEGVQYLDPAQGLDASVTSIEASDVSLFRFLTGSRKLGLVAVDGYTVIYTQDAESQVTDNDEVSEEKKVEAKPFQIAHDLSGELKLTNGRIEYHASEVEPVVLTLASDSVKIADIRDISFAFAATLTQGDQRGEIVLAGDVLNLFDPDGRRQAEQADYDLVLDVSDLPTSALDQAISGAYEKVDAGRLRAVLGEGSLSAKATVNGMIDALSSDLTITTPKLHVQLRQRTENDTLIASPDSFIKLDLDQESFAAIFQDSGLKLHKPTVVDLESLEMSLPIVSEVVDWGQSTASLVLKADDNLAVVDDRGEVLGINDLRIEGGSESIAGKLSFKLTTTLSAVDTNSEVATQTVVVDLDVIQPMAATREIAFFSEKLPITLIDALVGKDWQLPLWLGETLALDADLRGALGDDDQFTQFFAIRPEGRVTGSVTGSFSKGRYRFATPKGEPIEAELSPEAFSYLMSMLSGRPDEPALTIDQNMPVFVTLRDPTRGAVSIKTKAGKEGLERFYPDPDQTYLGATIELSPARVFDPKLKKTYELRGGEITLSAPDLRGKTDLRAELDLWVRPDAGKEGVSSLLTWQTTVTDLLDSEGSVPMDGQALMQQLAASGAMQLENVPSGLMDTLLNREGDLASILGPVVQQMDAGFTYQNGQPTGATVRLNWDDQNNQPMPGSWASMKPAAFDIDEQQMLTVRGGQDLELEVKVSEEFGNRWMGKLHPILFDAKSGDRPVKIKIDGKSFRFPLKGDKMLGSRVEASVDLGTVQFGDDALLGKLLQWTDRPGERAVFEPAVVKLVDGKVSYDQFDLAVGKVKLRLDGEVDLASGKIVDMAVRVPGDALIRVFNELDGLIKPDDYLSIPMSGEIRKPTFDSKLIGREVARLVTRGLIDQQKDSLKDLIEKGLGRGDKDRPNPAKDPEKPDGQKPADPEVEPEPKERIEEQIQEELIERAFDFLRRRTGGNQQNQGQPEDESK